MESLYIETLANKMQKRARYLCANETMTRCHPKMTPLESNSGVHSSLSKSGIREDPKLRLSDMSLRPCLGDYTVIVWRVILKTCRNKYEITTGSDVSV